MTMRKKYHLLLSHKRMNRYLLDVGLCKHKKIVGGEIDERVRLFPLAIVFLTPFVELKYGKRKIPVKLHELTTREASDVITRFKSYARGRRI